MFLDSSTPKFFQEPQGHLINLVRNIRQHVPVFRVLGEFKLRQFDPLEFIYIVKIINQSRGRMSITDIGIEFYKERRCDTIWLVPSIDFPVKVDQMDYTEVEFHTRQIISILVEGNFGKTVQIRPYCEDVSGKKHYGKWEKFDYPKSEEDEENS